MSTSPSMQPYEKRWTSVDDGPPANRRKPRQYATVDMSPSEFTPFFLDFCTWLQSEAFGINRKVLLQASGAKWIAD